MRHRYCSMGRFSIIGSLLVIPHYTMGESEYEKKLVDLGIKQILARIKHQQANGKLKRLHGEIDRKLHRFEASSYGSTVRNSESGHAGGPFNTEPAKPALERFMEWYNYRRAHMPLGWENRETPAQAFLRKMTPAVETVVYEQTGGCRAD